MGKIRNGVSKSTYRRKLKEKNQELLGNNKGVAAEE